MMKSRQTFKPMWLVSAVVIWICLYSHAHANPLEEAEVAYNAQDFVSAFQLFQPLANAGNARAQYRLGVMFMDGMGIKQSDAEAMKWWLLAAKQGEPNAQMRVGAMYGTGRGLGWRAPPFIYAIGWGRSEDYVESYKWLSIAMRNFSGTNEEKYKQCLSTRDLIASKMSSDDIRKAEIMVKSFYL